MKINVYTFCYNELDILPFVVDYWKLYADRVIVYDNYSTDGSYEYLKKIDFVDVRRFDTGDEINDEKLTELKNTVYLDDIDDVDYVVVCDMDECIFHPNLKQYMEYNPLPIYQPKFITLSDISFPKYDGRLIHEIIKQSKTGGGYTMDWKFDEFRLNGTNPGKGPKRKCVLFNPKKVKVKFDIGGFITKYPSPTEVMKYNNDDIVVFHLDDVGFSRKINKFNRCERRCSKDSRIRQMAWFYGEDRKKTIKDFLEINKYSRYNDELNSIK